jgi:hypothetical protein
MDELVAYCEKADSSSDIVFAVKAGLKKLEIYYEKTDDSNIYTVATSKLN